MEIILCSMVPYGPLLNQLITKIFNKTSKTIMHATIDVDDTNFSSLARTVNL